MSENRVSGLASAFEAPRTTEPAPSAVSSLASRFEAPVPVSTEPKVSDKLSGIANRFGATVADLPAKNAAAGQKKPAPAPETPKPAPVVAERPDFSAITARFSEGRAGAPDEEKPAEPGMFATAADRFRKIEEDARPPVEGKVSAFARNIESGAHKASEKGGTKPVLGEKMEEEARVVAEQMQGVGNIKSRFEGAAAKKVGEAAGVEGEPSLSDRFQTAAKLFEGEKKEAEGEQGPAVGSKFADASKLFGGGAK